jgi:hypothetical protein
MPGYAYVVGLPGGEGGDCVGEGVVGEIRNVPSMERLIQEGLIYINI